MFEKGVPKNFFTSDGSRLTTSSQQFKDGTHSLQWDFLAGAKLQITGNIGFEKFAGDAKDQRRDAFTLWLYNETPIAAPLLFQYATDQQVKASFEVNLNFHGWRGIVVHFETDMQGQPEATMNRLIVSPPERLQRQAVFRPDGNAYACRPTLASGGLSSSLC